MKKSHERVFKAKNRKTKEENTKDIGTGEFLRKKFRGDKDVNVS